MSGIMHVMTSTEEDVSVGTWDDAEEILNRVLSNEDDFFSMSEDLGGEEYIQASLWNLGIVFRSYLVEVRTLFNGTPRHMRLKTRHIEDVRGACYKYFNGDDPVGPSWYDVTDEFEEDVSS